MEFIKVFLPEIFLFSCSLYQLLLIARFLKFFKLNVPCLNEELFVQSIFIYVCLLVLLINQKLTGYSNNFLFIFDNSSIYLKILLNIVILFSFITIWRAFINQKVNFFEYFIILFLAIFGLLLLINAYDLISVYLILELQALCFYILAAFRRNSSFSTEAGLKYFILGSFISGIFLLGCLLIYAVLGTTNFQKIILLLSFNLDFNFFFLIFLGFFLVLSTILFKITVAPFHFWSPDVYEGSPLASTIFFSLAPKVSLITLLSRWLAIFLPIFEGISIFLLVIGLFSIFWGAYFALSQKRFKRFLIYSSISQIGFLIIGFSEYTVESFSAVFFFLIIYLISSIIIWGFLNNFYTYNIIKSHLKNIVNIKPILLTDLSLLFKSNFIWSITLLILFFSFGGIPPFIGFFSKVLIIFSLIHENTFFVSIILVLISVISSYYYLRVVKVLFFENSKKLFFVRKQNFYNGSFIELESILYSICLCLLLLLFFFPSFLILTSNYLILDFF
uniref:NADH dehydrogenase subunit 2 n=1 Tax=Synura synuroidea TaxID=47573 RepID=Q9MGA6_9STRA|nr:NADH dehydrogenase subunit 2 [Synura synuroidea]AAF36943.1 NADH dehydrogenase subunit 2 [Synura synuroidea]